MAKNDDIANVLNGLELDQLLHRNTSLFDTVLRDIADETIARNKALKKHAQMLSKPTYNVLMDRYQARPNGAKMLKICKLNKLADPLRGRFSHYDTIAKAGELLSTSPSSRSRGKASNVSSEKYPKVQKNSLEEKEGNRGIVFFLTETDGVDENLRNDNHRAVTPRSVKIQSDCVTSNRKPVKSKTITGGGARYSGRGHGILREWDESFAAKRLPAPRWKKSYPSDDEVLRKKGIIGRPRPTGAKGESATFASGPVDRKAQLNDVVSKVIAAKQNKYRAPGSNVKKKAAGHVVSPGKVMRSSSASNKALRGRLAPLGRASQRKLLEAVTDSRGLPTTATNGSSAPVRKRQQVASAPSLLSTLQRVDSNPVKATAPLPFGRSRRAFATPSSSASPVSHRSPTLVAESKTDNIKHKALYTSSPGKVVPSRDRGRFVLKSSNSNTTDGDRYEGHDETNAANAVWLGLNDSSEGKVNSPEIDKVVPTAGGITVGSLGKQQPHKLRTTTESLQALEKAAYQGRFKSSATATGGSGKESAFDSSSGVKNSAVGDDTAKAAAKLMMFAKRVEGNFKAATTHMTGYKKILDEDGSLSVLNGLTIE